MATLTASIFCGLRTCVPRPQLFSKTVPSCSNCWTVRRDNGKWPTAYQDERETISAFPLHFRQKQHGLWYLLHLGPSPVCLPSLVHWMENTRYFSRFSTRHMCHLTHLQTCCTHTNNSNLHCMNIKNFTFAFNQYRIVRHPAVSLNIS